MKRTRNSDDFGFILNCLMSDERELAQFKRAMGDFVNRSDREILCMINELRAGAMERERQNCIRNLSLLAQNNELCSRQMRERVKMVRGIMDSDLPSNPGNNPRGNQSRGLLSLLILLFLLRSID
ncbi:MAG: hypothetical protein ACOYI2_03555 [Bacillota bacterium]